MALLLDPRLALVWRTPTSLQIGVDHPVVTLHDVSTADERMLGALIPGISASGLAMIGHSAGATDAEIGIFLTQVRPALVPTRPPVAHTPSVIAIDGHGPTVGHICALLADGGFTVVSADPESTPDDTTAAILIAHFVTAPHRAGGWLRRDIPHLPVIFGDTEVRIGPFVDPENGPCMHCIDLHHRDGDASWTAMASQLLGRIGPTETFTISWEVATIVARLVTARLKPMADARASASARASATAQDRAFAQIMRHLNVATGAISEQQWRRHPECGCRSLSGNGMADGVATGSNRIRPTTAAAYVSRA